MTAEAVQSVASQSVDAKRPVVFRLGRVTFSITNCDTVFEKELHELLPRCDEDVPLEQVVEIKTGCSRDVRGLLNHIFKRHSGCLWIDAGCLISPNNRKVLIAGQSGAGKSTLTMALALGYGWKVLAEDVLLIDCKADNLLTFASPFSLKDGTFELLKSTVGKAPEPILLDEWSPLKEMSAKGEFAAEFDLSILVERPNGRNVDLQTSAIPAQTLLRRVLPISNILRIDGASEKALSYFDRGQCLNVVGGTLRERIDLLLELDGTAAGTVCRGE